MKESTNKNDEETIEIPIGKFFKLSKLRENPWIITTIVFALAFILILVFKPGGITGDVVNEEVVGNNIISFINSQGRGEASLVSVDRDGSLYNVVVKYNGEDIPIYATLDGNYLISDLIPLSNSVTGNSGDSSGRDNTQKVENIEIDNAPSIGEINAKVVIVEFSDYECPFCGRFYTETLPQIKKSYIDTGKVRLVYKDLPLSFHPNAQKAAEAARCVGAQKNELYFKMHDKLFENQQSLSEENYKKWAREIGANGAKFDSCLSSGEFADEVKADLEYGERLGVSGTPAFFINGISVSGAQPYNVFEQIIEAELNK